jgi:glucan phosphoethanolaminetransferase (alkaline phosphatase superfamily)
MFEVLTYVDIGLAAVMVLLALGKARGHIVARRKGLTRNVSRLMAHGLIGVLMLAYIRLSVGWLQTYHTLGTEPNVTGMFTMLWVYCLLGLAIVLLVTLEISTHVRALSSGHTRNISRLITCLLMFVVMLIMLGVNMKRWNAFIDELEAPYHDMIPISAASSLSSAIFPRLHPQERPGGCRSPLPPRQAARLSLTR